MVYIFGKNISNNKKTVFGISSIYGIGLKTAYFICNAVKINPQKYVSKLTENEIRKITDYIQKNFITENLLRKNIHLNINELISIRHYRGVRHQMSLPVRGQRTRSNAKTQKNLAKKRYK